MKIFINGVESQVERNKKLSEFIASYLNGKEPRGIAVALNEKIIRKEDWVKTGINEMDRIEIVTAVQGG